MSAGLALTLAATLITVNPSPVTEGAPATLVGYRTSVLRLQLKPVVGGLVACLVYMPLSWQVVPGIPSRHRRSSHPESPIRVRA